jgi:Protein of Unknown function (DUF2784)
MSATTYQQLADLVLVLHFGIVVFVVAGLALIVAGNLAGWDWVNAWWFRGAHLGAIAVVVAEAWLGITCPLTTFEAWLRAQTGAVVAPRGFVEHWVQRLLFYEAPVWVFTAGYTLFGVLVVAAWWRFPPGRGRAGFTRRSSRTPAASPGANSTIRRRPRSPDR